MTEKTIVQRSVRILQQRGAWTVPQTGVAIAGIPDRIGAYRGTPIALEFKQPGKHPRPIQQHHLDQAARAGVWTRVITDPTQIHQLLDQIDGAL